MDHSPIRILLIEDNPGDVDLLQEILAEDANFELMPAALLSEALLSLSEVRCDVILLDLVLPDSQGLATLVKLRTQVPEVPIVVLTGLNDEDLSVQAVQLGAQDYLVKGYLDRHSLSRAMRYAIERQRAEEERAQLLAREQAARREAEAANRLKDEFLATVSHELRTPLQAVLGWVHLLRTKQQDEDAAARALEKIENNARVQAQLIEDLLDVSRIVTGKLRLDVRPIELATVIEAAINTVQSAIEAKEINLQATFDPAADLVLGDPDRLQQAIWNLLANAIKFTPKGGRVEIRLRRIGSRAEIRVSDTGQGIAPDFLPHVFERFRQADASSTRKHGGLGLGLAIVRHLVESHGGTVQAESPGVGQGATFIVQLPAVPSGSRKNRVPGAASGGQ